MPARPGGLRRRLVHPARGGVPRRVRLRAGGADRLREPRRGDARAHARADRRAASGRGARARRAAPRCRASGAPRACSPASRPPWRAEGRHEPGLRAAPHPRLGRPRAVGLDGYRAKGGYEGLQQALAMSQPRSDRTGEGLRPARPRRRRVPDGHEVVVRPAGHRQAHLRHRQLRRVRAGHLQQPRARRTRPPPADRGHGDRGARDRLPHRVHLRPRRVPVAGASCSSRRSTRPTRRVPGQRASPAATTTSTSCCTGAPAPTSAARRRRCSTRWRACAASRGCARRSPRSRGCTPRRP